jgi:hypothetical protein
MPLSPLFSAPLLHVYMYKHREMSASPVSDSVKKVLSPPSPSGSVKSDTTINVMNIDTIDVSNIVARSQHSWADQISIVLQGALPGLLVATLLILIPPHHLVMYLFRVPVLGAVFGGLLLFGYMPSLLRELQRKMLTMDIVLFFLAAAVLTGLIFWGVDSLITSVMDAV